MKTRNAFAAIMLFSSGVVWSSPVKNEGAVARADPAASKSIKVGSFNIRNSACDKQTPNAWALRAHDVIGLIRDMDLDVFGLQEVMPDQAKELKENLAGWDFVCVHRGVDLKSDEASPVFFRKGRFVRVKDGTFWLSETPEVPGSKGWGASFSRICTWVVLKDVQTGREFCFATTHADWGRACEKGMELILERMKVFAAGIPVVFTGDHNCLEDEKPAKTVAGVLRDALYKSERRPRGSWRSYNAWSWRDAEAPIAQALKFPIEVRNARKPIENGTLVDGRQPCEVFGPRMDFIYVSPGVRVLEFATINAPRPGKRLYPSDHFPIVATIVVR